MSQTPYFLRLPSSLSLCGSVYVSLQSLQLSADRGVEGLGFRGLGVYWFGGLGFRVEGLGFRGFGFRVWSCWDCIVALGSGRNFQGDMLLIFYGSGFRVEGSHLLHLKPRPAPASSCPRSELRNEGLRDVRQCEGLAIHGCVF